LKIWTNSTKIIFHLPEQKYEINDIILLEKTGILIVACASNFEGNNVMESMKFWKKKEKAGEILIYKLNTNNILSDKKKM